MTSTLTSTTNTVAKGQPQMGKASLESTIHRLKLAWIMASDEAEKRKVSEEIRRQLQSSK